MRHRSWYLALILLLALFLRWWQVEAWFHFTMDEALIAWRGWGLFELQRPFLIGGISPLQIHLPPYFYYFSSLLLLPFQFDPVGWGWWAGLFSLLTIYLIYRHSHSLLAALFYAVSLNAVVFDRHYWPLFFNPIFTLLTLGFLKKNNDLGLMLTLVAAVTADPSNLTLGLFVLLYRANALKKYFWLGAGLFLAPLILFDVRHGWQNFGGITRLLNRTSQGLNIDGLVNGLMLLPQSLARFWYTAQTNLVEIYGYCLPFAQARLSQINTWILLAAVWLLVISFRRQREWSLLLLSYAAGLGLFGLLGFSLFDHYLTGLLPVWAIISAAAVRLMPKPAAFILTGLFITVNLLQFARVKNDYGLTDKKALINWSHQYLAGSSWELLSESKCHKENGLRYLFELSGNAPAKSFMDNDFGWLYPVLPTGGPVDKILLVSDHGYTWPNSVIASKVFGDMTAYILQP